MSKKIKADMGKLEEIQMILENNAKKITHNITRIGELHKEIDVCWESQMWDSCYKTYCDLKKELEENAKEYEEYPKKLKACIEGYQETEEAIESLSQELPAMITFSTPLSSLSRGIIPIPALYPLFCSV